MLYRFIGSTGSGTSTTALDRIVNSKYDNALYITNELQPKSVLKKLKAYEKNTQKVIVNDVTVKAIPYGETTDDALEILLNQAVENKKDCVLIDRLEGISCADGECVVSPETYYDDLCDRLANFSKDNSIDIIVVQSMNRPTINMAFDEVMEKFGEHDLPDNEEHILVYKSSLESGTPFVKIYERRNNLIRSFNITQYFEKNDDAKTTQET